MNPLQNWLSELAHVNHPIIRRMRKTVEAMHRTGEFAADVTALSDVEFIALLASGTEGSRPPVEGGED